MAKAHPVSAGRRAETTDRYLELIQRSPLRPIRSENELARAIEILNSLLDQDELSADEEDYLEVLGDLIKKYETAHHPMPQVSNADMLRHLIEASGTTQAAVAASTGIAVSTISELLAGKRRFNLRHIEALAPFFHVDPGVFITAGRRWGAAMKQA